MVKISAQVSGQGCQRPSLGVRQTRGVQASEHPHLDWDSPRASLSPLIYRDIEHNRTYMLKAPVMNQKPADK